MSLSKYVTFHLVPIRLACDSSSIGTVDVLATCTKVLIVIDPRTCELFVHISVDEAIHLVLCLASCNARDKLAVFVVNRDVLRVRGAMKQNALQTLDTRDRDVGKPRRLVKSLPERSVTVFLSVHPWDFCTVIAYATVHGNWHRGTEMLLNVRVEVEVFQ